MASIYVIEDDAGTREVIKELLASSGIETTLCDSAHQFEAVFDASQPALLILDVRLPDTSGLDLLDHLRQRDAVIAAIVVTGYADVEMAVRALKLGAVEFLEKPLRAHSLLDKVQRARELLDARWTLHRQCKDIKTRLETLTPREHQVLDLVMDGCPNKVVAATLDLSLKTVEFHRAHVMQKMQADSVVDLVRQVFVAAGDAASAAAGGGLEPGETAPGAGPATPAAAAGGQGTY